ncbi:MAG: CoA transferase [Chloroflexi bacterium]|nr:MAG: CoA transferase [Chloroflexota bacterium]
MRCTLDGIRVLDLTRNIAGPYCTMILADLGADTVKVERCDGGDDTRDWSPPSWNGESAMFLSVNRNKRSLGVDLDADEGAAIVRRLAQGADVMVESFRPGALTRRGLGAEQLRADNPGLVHCSISGFGARGPMRDRPGYDPLLQAYSGLMSMTGEPERAPVRIGTAIVDIAAGMWAAIGILAGLQERARSGLGCTVETSLFETAVAWLGYHITGYLGGGTLPERLGSQTAMIAPYEVFAAADAPLFAGAPSDRQFRRLAAALGMAELADDSRFASNASRVEHRAQLHRVVEERLRTRTAAEWEALLTAEGLPCSRVRSIADLVDDPQLEALGLLAPLPHPRVPDLRLVDMPFSCDGARARQALPPPLLGEHTDEILSGIGYDAAGIAGLRRRRVVA